MRATNGVPLGCSPLLPVDTGNCVQKLKVFGLFVGVKQFYLIPPTEPKVELDGELFFRFEAWCVTFECTVRVWVRGLVCDI